MNMTTTNYRQILERRKGQLEQCDSMIATTQKNLARLQGEQEEIEQAQVIIMETAQQTQQQLEFHISNIVSLAQAAVFDDPYTCQIEFVQKRNQTEADISLVRNGAKVEDPLSGAGGGACDVAGFGLRVALWSLKSPKTRPILILDEPFSRLKGRDANMKAIQMVKTVADKLNLQVLMVSDERVSLEDIEKGADNIIRVSIKKGVSYVE